jgi:hypothetical protein
VQQPIPGTFNLNLSPQCLNAINMALQEAPYKIAAPAIAEINQQLQQAQKPRHDPDAPAPATPEDAAAAAVKALAASPLGAATPAAAPPVDPTSVAQAAAAAVATPPVAPSA